LGNPTRFYLQPSSPAISHDGGNAYWNINALSTPAPDFDFGAWEFVKDVDGYLNFYFDLPKVINNTTPNAKIILRLLANATTGVSSFDVETRPRAEGETLDVALDSTMAIQDVPMPTTAFVEKEVTFTLPTSGNDHPVQSLDTLLCMIKHNGTKGEDTIAVNTLMKPP